MEVKLLLAAGKLTQTWASMSGGERQRAIIACGIILAGAGTTAQPPQNGSTIPTAEQQSLAIGAAAARTTNAVLLMDEPTAACDVLACAAVERVLIESGVACIIVTHDERQAARLANIRVMLR